MTIYYVGGEMGSLIPSTSNVHEDQPAGAYDTSFARCAMKGQSASDYSESPSHTNLTDVWLHFEVDGVAFTGTYLGTILTWHDSGGVARIQLLYNTADSMFYCQYWNGAAWVTAGSGISLSLGNAKQTMDVHAVVNSASGSIKVYIAGTERINSGTIDLSGATNLQKFRLYGTTFGTLRLFYWSQLIVADENTIGMRLMTMYASGVGSDSAWGSGSYASINEITYNDVDLISSATANQVSTFAATLVAATTGYTIRAVGVAARAKCDATGPQNLQLALRVSGTNYFSSSLALSAGYGAFVNVWNTSPATSSPWSVSELSGIQFGVKSIA